MNKICIRLSEISAHLDLVAELMKDNDAAVMEGTLLKHYAYEINELADEAKDLVSSTN